MSVNSILLTTLGLIILIIFLWYTVRLYNYLIGSKNAINYSLSSLDALLKKRHDLIPNLVKTVKRYMHHEASLLRQITELRTMAATEDISIHDRMVLDSEMARLTKNIVLYAENYPTLYASDNFLQLQASLNEVEEQISASRRALSASITDYNNAIQMFPTNIMAYLMGYKEFEWYSIPEDERQSLDVERLF